MGAAALRRGRTQRAWMTDDASERGAAADTRTPATTTRERLQAVRSEIASAAAACGRRPGEVTLVAVSKGHSADAVREAYAAGQRDFGESYAAELAAKAATLGDLSDIAWHFVGHLQRNKARVAVPHLRCLHSLDSVAGLAAVAAATSGSLDILVQVNVAEDPRKHGCSAEALPSLLAAAAAHPPLRLRGLMTLPPQELDPGRCFARLAELHRVVRQTLPGPIAADFDQLSMGMSDDFAEAIAVGATMVRVGTAIFGRR